MGATPPPPGSGWPPPGGSNFPPPQDRPPQDRPPAPGPGQPGGWSPPPPGGPPPGQGGWPSGQQQPPPGPWQAPPPGGYGPYGSPYGRAAGGYGMPKASWGARLAAIIIDGLILALMGLPAWLYLIAGPTEITTCSVDSSGDLQFGGPDNALCEQPTGATIAIAVVLGIVAFIGLLAYFGILEGQRTQTLGKKALGIRTVDIQTGGPIGTGKAIGRYFARILSGIPCYLGYLWPLWDDQSQSFHDKIVGSVVVKA